MKTWQSAETLVVLMRAVVQSRSAIVATGQHAPDKTGCRIRMAPFVIGDNRISNRPAGGL
jgi:hypothetical protein